MIQSNATKYAIRAVCYLAATQEEGRSRAREISDALEIPYAFLSKILHDLAKKGLLTSSKGPGGGFRLNCVAADTSLYSLVEAVERPLTEGHCVLGLEVCSPETRCPMHEMWQQCRYAFQERLRTTSLQDVVEAADCTPRATLRDPTSTLAGAE